MKRTLRLRSESLTELTADQLGGVAGAAGEITILSCPVLRCLPTYKPLDCVNVPTMPDNCYTFPWC